MTEKFTTQRRHGDQNRRSAAARLRKSPDPTDGPGLGSNKRWESGGGGYLGVLVRDVGEVAFDLHQAGATSEHAVEFVDEQRHGFVAFVGSDGRVHVGTVDRDVALGLEARADGFLGVAFELDADAHDAFFMTKQSFRFLLHESLERRSQLEMDAGNDQFMLILSVHISAYVFG